MSFLFDRYAFPTMDLVRAITSAVDISTDLSPMVWAF